MSVSTQPPGAYDRREPDDLLVPEETPAMSFGEHLEELRRRLIYALVGLVPIFALCLVFGTTLMELILRPLQNQLRAANLPVLLQATGPMETFSAWVKVALIVSLVVGIPLALYQLWLFIAPGLYRRERRMGVVFAVTSAICFIGGAVFCYYLVLPPVFDFLLGFSTDNLASISHELGIEVELEGNIALHPLLTMNEYVSFARKLLIGFGIIFELPLVIFFLSLIGVVTHRGLWKFNRWWIVLSFVISASLTPPDVISQLLMAGPLVILYNMSIGISWVVTRRRERAQAEATPTDPSR
jgi:sec-independent protein translocase protein TatC